MNISIPFRRNVAAAIAVAGLCWLVVAVNSLGNDAQRGAALLLRTPAPVAVVSRSQTTAVGDGLDLVDMYQCMCAGNQDISQWVNWWVVAVIVGGLPTAVMVHTRTHS
jgi:hypothetical protein